MENVGNLLVGSMLSCSSGIFSVLFLNLGISEEANKAYKIFKESNRGLWNEEIAKAYQIYMQEGVLLTKKVIVIFPLVHAVGTLMGSYTAKTLEEKLNLQDSKKKIFRVGVVFTITALFTFCLTKSTALSAVNSVMTAVWQWKYPVFK